MEPGPEKIPRTRPVVSVNKGMNVFLNEILSDLIDPLANLAKDSPQVISTEDSL